MTEQEFLRSKNNMLELLKRQINFEKAKLDILRSYQVQVENTHIEEDLRRLHREIFHIINE